MWADLRAAVRALRRAPAFSALVVLVLAFGIAVNVATFGAVDALLFRPPAGVRDPGGVRVLRVDPPAKAGQRVFINLGLSRGDGDALRARRDQFARLGLYNVNTTVVRTDPAVLGLDPARRKVRVTLADADYFRALGVAPARGRLFADDEVRASSAGDVVVLTDAYWRGALGGDPRAIGRMVRLNGRAYTVVGVLPSGFRGTTPEPVDLFAPLSAAPALSFYAERARDPDAYWLNALVRLAPGADARGAAAVASGVLRGRDAARPHSVLGFDLQAGRRVRAVGLTDRFGAGPDAPSSPVPFWLLGATAAVLLVACANVANLLLVRAERRRREIATRAAVGAGRGRLVRQLFAEGAVLAALGGTLGVVLAAAGARLFRLVPGMPAVEQLVDARAALFAVAVTVATTLLFALAPAVMAARASHGAELLRAGARQVAQRAPLRTALLAVQFAASLALLGAGGLFVRSLRNVRAVELGFDAERTLLAAVDWKSFGVDDAAADRAQRAAMARLRATPGVAGVTRLGMAPFEGIMMGTLRVPGRTDLAALSGAPGGMFFMNVADTGYPAALGAAVVRGRWLAAGDDAGPGAVVVNEAFARRVWPGADAVGRCVTLDLARDACTRVAGVVRDTRYLGVTDSVAPMFYQLRPDTLRQPGALLVRVHPGAPPAAVRRVAAQVGSALRAAEPRVRFATATTVADAAFGETLAPYRLGAAAFTLFGTLALGMAAVGLYGVAAYAVAQRTGEFGVRVALGARGRDVAGLVLRQGLRTVAVGGAVGVLGAVAVGRVLRARLYGVEPLDPLTLIVATAVLATAALAATWLPARRAARVDPATALRSE